MELHKKNTLGSPYGSGSPTASGVLSAGKMRKYVMIYYANASSWMLSNSKGKNVESNLTLF